MLKNLEDFEPNDLKYDRRVLEERFLYDGLSFDLATDAGEPNGAFGLPVTARLRFGGVSDPPCPLSSVPKPGRRLRSVEAAPGDAGCPRRAQPRADRHLPAPPGSSLHADGQGDARWGVTGGTVPSGGV